MDLNKSLAYKHFLVLTDRTACWVIPSKGQHSLVTFSIIETRTVFAQLTILGHTNISKYSQLQTFTEKALFWMFTLQDTMQKSLWRCGEPANSTIKKCSDALSSFRLQERTPRAMIFRAILTWTKHHMNGQHQWSTLQRKVKGKNYLHSRINNLVTLKHHHLFPSV